MRRMRLWIFLFILIIFSALLLGAGRDSAAPAALTPAEAEKRFLAAADNRLALEHLKVLTSEPHLAGTAGARRMAEYVAQKYREAGLETEIVEYSVWLPHPKEIRVEVTAPAHVEMRGPSPERVEGDPFQADPRVVMPYSAFSPSGEVEAEVVYANYGRPEDFKTLAAMGVEVRGKIVVMRYGENYRGVKAFVAQEHGAAGAILYSDPMEDGYFKGDMYPRGPWRPESGVQRGSIGYIFEHPGDPTTPGVASVPGLPQSKRVPAEKSVEMPRVLTAPLSAREARPILENLGGPESPRAWQGALPFTYHLGPGPVKVHMRLRHEYAYRPLWNVIGRLRGSELPDEWVIVGNHRDAWVYGAVDPNSGTAAQLEAVHGVGELLKSGWRPRRSIIFASWDGEEFGLIGSTEWAEQYARDLANAVAYLNIDAAVSGPNFSASAVPSLKAFMREVSKSVPAAGGGTVYEAWRKAAQEKSKPVADPQVSPGTRRTVGAQLKRDVPVGDLGSGSDYTPFLQHLGIPSSDAATSGSYGVYHSAFDNFAWFTRFADPEGKYLQQMARFIGLEALRIASAEVLPFDYQAYGREVAEHLQAARKQAEAAFGPKAPSFTAAIEAARRLEAAGKEAREQRGSGRGNDARNFNRALRDAERALLLPGGLPGRPWYRHAVYAPGRYTGYAAVVIPGVNEAIEASDARRSRQQLEALTAALDRATAALKGQP